MLGDLFAAPGIDDKLRFRFSEGWSSINTYCGIIFMLIIIHAITSVKWHIYDWLALTCTIVSVGPELYICKILSHLHD